MNKTIHKTKLIFFVSDFFEILSIQTVLFFFWRECKLSEFIGIISIKKDTFNSFIIQYICRALNIIDVYCL